jgi:hypothetical protein
VLIYIVAPRRLRSRFCLVPMCVVYTFFLRKGVCIIFAWRVCRYPDAYRFVPNGEEEAEFEDYRTRLKTAFTNIARIKPAEVLAMVNTAFLDKVRGRSQLQSPSAFWSRVCPRTPVNTYDDVTAL